MQIKHFLSRGLLCILMMALSSFVYAQGPEQEAAEDDPAGEELAVHALSEVPAVVMASARTAAPDVFWMGAESYWENDFRVYRVSGRLYREVWNAYIREDGKVLRTESDTQEN